MVYRICEVFSYKICTLKEALLNGQGWNALVELYNLAAKSPEEAPSEEEKKESTEDTTDSTEKTEKTEKTEIETETEKAEEEEAEKKDEAGEEEQKKKFKIPNIPKALKNIRSKSKEREKNKVRKNWFFLAFHLLL